MKKKICIGNNIWLVEGSARWAIYDLSQEKIVQITREAGEILFKLSKERISGSEKRELIMREAPVFHRILSEEGLFDRLFKKCNKIDFKEKYYIIWVELTNACNLRCIHCYMRAGERKSIFIDKEILDKVIVDASNIGFQHIQFTGGEPFLYPGLWDAVKKVRDIGSISTIEIYTNLTLVNEKDIELMKKYKVKIATTLLGSSPQVHNRCAGVKGSFKRFLRNIQIIRDSGVDFRVAVIIMPENERDVENIKTFMKKEDILPSNGEFSPEYVRPVGRGERIKGYRVSSRIGELKFHVNPEFFFMAQKWNTCWGGEIAVASDGKVFPCVFARDIVLGNLYKDSLIKIIRGERTQRLWRINPDKIQKCKDCEFRYACIDCRVLPLKEGRGLFGEPSRCNYNPYE